MVIARKGNGAAQKLLILVNALDEGRKQQQKLRVLTRGLARGQQVLAGVGGQRPVDVLARAVHARKGLFVQQANQTVAVCDLLHDLHLELVLIARGVCVGVYRCKLVLRRCDLVVAGLGQNAQLPELTVKILHVRRNAGSYRAEVVVLKLLTLGGLCAEKRSAAKAQILTLEVELLIDKEILLLGA